MTAFEKVPAKWTRRNIIIGDELWNEIRELAWREDQSMSSLVRQALLEFLKKMRGGG